MVTKTYAGNEVGICLRYLCTTCIDPFEDSSDRNSYKKHVGVKSTNTVLNSFGTNRNTVMASGPSQWQQHRTPLA